MADYISRDAAMLAISEQKGNVIDHPYNVGLGRAQSIISNIPAADVAPVVHAHWEDVSVDDEGSMLIASMFCPNCKRWHNEVYHYGNPTEMAHYCPNCGAKMEKARGEDDV